MSQVNSGTAGRGRRALRRIAIGAAVAALAASSGCATLGRGIFEEPVVNFKALRVNGLGVSGGSLDIVLSVYNPNGFRLQATQLSYNLMMDSVRIADGLLDDDFIVQSGDSSDVVIPVSFTYAGLGRAGQELLRSGTVNYRVLGDVTVATPLGNFTRPYDRTGRFSPLSGAR